MHLRFWLCVPIPVHWSFSKFTTSYILVWLNWTQKIGLLSQTNTDKSLTNLKISKFNTRYTVFIIQWYTNIVWLLSIFKISWYLQMFFVKKSNLSKFHRNHTTLYFVIITSIYKTCPIYTKHLPPVKCHEILNRQSN